MFLKSYWGRGLESRLASGLPSGGAVLLVAADKVGGRRATALPTADLLISTLSGFVAAMGGKLSLVVEFPDRPPVALTGLTALDDPSESDPSTP